MNGINPVNKYISVDPLYIDLNETLDTPVSFENYSQGATWILDLCY